MTGIQLTDLLLGALNYAAKLAEINAKLQIEGRTDLTKEELQVVYDRISAKEQVLLDRYG